MRAYHRWLPMEDELLIALYERRMTCDKIAERIGEDISPNAVRSRIETLRRRSLLPYTYRIRRRNPAMRKRWGTGDLAKVAEMKTTGKTNREIAEEFGVSRSAIQSLLCRLRDEGRL